MAKKGSKRAVSSKAVRGKKVNSKHQAQNPKLKSFTFFSRITEVLRNSREYFTAVKDERFGEPLLFYLPFMIISALLGGFTLPQMFSLPFSSGLFVVIFIAEIVLQLAALFCFTGITYLCLSMFKGQGNYLDTFKAGVYGSTPALLWTVVQGVLSLAVPGMQGNLSLMMSLGVVSLAFMLWSIYLEVIGLSLYHKVSGMRAFFAGVVTPLVLLFVVVVLMVFGFLLLFYRPM